MGHQNGSPMTPPAELSSISTALDDLSVRLRGLIEGIEGAERDALGTELAEVERALDGARRRLARVVSGERSRRR